MLKQIGLACCLSLLIWPSAQALPGKTLAETEAWVKSHSFLSTWMLGNDPSMDDYELYRLAFRELQDHWFIDVEMTFNEVEEGKSRLQSKIYFDTLQLVQKTYVGDAKSDEEKAFDARPWQDVACKNIWTRDNATAQQLLSKIYSPAIAQDFKTAKLAYQGPFIIPARVGYGHEGPLWWPDKGNQDDLKQRGFTRRVSSDVAIYVGAQYSYEVRSDDFPGESDLPVKSSPDCTLLKINPRQWGIENAAVLKHNLALNQRWEQEQNAKNQRNEPADIEVD